MPYRYIHILPIIEGLWHIILFSLTYTISVVNKDLPSVLPYVSDTGAHSIQKYIFSFGITIGALLVFTVMYIRHLQVRDLLKLNQYAKILFKLNRLSLIYSTCTSVGLIILAALPILPHFYIHTGIGCVTFSFAMMVIHIETYLSYKLYPRIGSKGLNVFRLILSVILPIGMLIVVITLIISLYVFNGSDTTQWTKKYKGYKAHVISAVFEWTVVLIVVLYPSLYAYEFKAVTLYKPKINTLLHA